MHVSVVGSGYVGTTAAACLADAGHAVTAVDIDSAVVEAINTGEAPIHEPGLSSLISTHGGKRLTATTEYSAIQETDLTMLALPTPSNSDGTIDTSIIEAAAESVGQALATKTGPHTVVIKSTVLPHLPEKQIIPRVLAGAAKTRDSNLSFVTNPEFLREGTAVNDFQNPHKIVIGSQDERAASQVEQLYQPVTDQADPEIIHTTIPAAMMIKYANNAFLASKISLINDIGNLCKLHDIDAYEIADAIGTDPRIGEQFLRSGVGWGGSCFPKDVAALIADGRQRDYTPQMLDAAVKLNQTQPERLVSLLYEHVDVAEKKIAVLGLAFKPGTDDVRNSRAFPVIARLRAAGAEVVAYDPVAADNAREVDPDLSCTDSPSDALQDAHGAVVVTDWDEFATLDEEFDCMEKPVVVDGRRIITRRDGITYEGLTW